MSSTPSTDELRDPMTAILIRVAKIQVEIKHMREDIDQLKRAIEGNGGPGLGVRVDRLERVERNRTWVVRVMLAAVLIVVATTGVQLVAKVVSENPSAVTIKPAGAMP